MGGLCTQIPDERLVLVTNKPTTTITNILLLCNLGQITISFVLLLLLLLDAEL